MLRKAFFLFIVWRIALLLITAFGLNTIPHITHPGWELNRINPGVEYWIHWANWDGGMYMTIAKEGYQIFHTVFFPLYPLLIKIVSLIGLEVFWAGFIISQVCTVLLIYFFYKLLRLDFNQQKSELIVILLLAFPTSFYLGAVYTESLFLLLAVSAIYFARIKKWYISALLVGLSMVTRNVGFAVLAAVVLEYLFGNYRPQMTHILRNRFARIGAYLIAINFIMYESLNLNILATNIWGGVISTVSGILTVIIISLAILLLIIYLYQRNKQFSLIKKVSSLPFLFLILSVLPFLGYLLFQYIQFGDSFAFINNQIGSNRKLTSPFLMIIDILQTLFSSNIYVITFWNHGTFERLFSLLLITGTIYSFFKLRFSYAIYFLGVTLIPLSSGIVVDMTRYALVAFPLFILISNINNRYLIIGWLFFSTCLLGILSIMYINSYWVL